MIAITSILILCSCNIGDDYVEIPDVSSVISIEDISHSDVDCSNKEDNVKIPLTLREQFKYKYGYDIDISDKQVSIQFIEP